MSPLFYFDHDKAVHGLTLSMLLTIYFNFKNRV